MHHQEQLKSIAELCLNIDRKAESFYATLMHRAENDELREFWRHMKEEEGDHVRFWIRLADAIDKGQIPMVFDRPREIYFELLETDRKADQMIQETRGELSTGDCFRGAYKMEFFLLHPSFEVLFQLAEERAGIPSPEEDYQVHIREFLKAFNRFGGSDLSLELAGDFLVQLWKENRRAARRIIELHSYRSVLPACASCGKIRDEQDGWIGADEFIRRVLHSDITHGICPDCSRELYPGIPQSDSQD